MSIRRQLRRRKRKILRWWYRNVPELPSLPTLPPPLSEHPSPVSQLLVLAGLSGFAIGQPVLAVMGDTPDAFVYTEVEGWAVAAWAVAVVVVPPLLLWGATLAARAFSVRLARTLHLSIVGVLAYLAVFQVLRWAVGLPFWIAVVVAVALVVAFVLAYQRSRLLVAWARYTAVLPAIAVASFLLLSDTGQVIWSNQAAAGGVASDLPSVVFVVLDEFPTKSLLDEDGQIDALRYPNLAAFTEDAVWYRRHTAAAAMTEYALPAMLTGTPPREAAPLWTDHPDNLFSLLAPTHDLVAFELVTVLCGSSSCSDGSSGGNPRFRELGDIAADLWWSRITPSERTVGFDDFQEEVGETDEPFLDRYGFAVRDVSVSAMIPTRFRDFLDTLSPGPRPSLNFVHLLLPHFPWRFYADGTMYNDNRDHEDFPFSLGNEGEWVPAFSEARHLEQASYTDQLVGALIGRLKAQDLYEDSIVVVVSDHGESFESDSGLRAPTPETVDSVAFAPLFIKPVGTGAGGIDDTNLSSLDIVPTLAAMMGIEVPWETAGDAADSLMVLGRGTEKEIDLIGTGGLGRSVRGSVLFDAERDFPRADERWVPPAEEGRSAVEQLYDRFGITSWIGRQADDLVTGAGGRASLEELRKHERPRTGIPPAAIVYGRVEDPPADGLVLVAADDVVVAGSPLYRSGDRDGLYGAMMPREVADQEKTLRLLLVVGDEVRELSFR